MESGDALGAIIDNFPLIVAVVLILIFGIACWMQKPVKATVSFVMVILSVIFGVM